MDELQLPPLIVPFIILGILFVIILLWECRDMQYKYVKRMHKRKLDNAMKRVRRRRW